MSPDCQALIILWICRSSEQLGWRAKRRRRSKCPAATRRKNKSTMLSYVDSAPCGSRQGETLRSPGFFRGSVVAVPASGAERSDDERPTVVGSRYRNPKCARAHLLQTWRRGVVPSLAGDSEPPTGCQWPEGKLRQIYPLESLDALPGGGAFAPFPRPGRQPALPGRIPGGGTSGPR